MKKKKLSENRLYIKQMNNYFRTLKLSIRDAKLTISKLQRENILNKKRISLEKESIRILNLSTRESTKVFKQWKKTNNLK